MFLNQEVKVTTLWIYPIEDLKGKKSFSTFHDQELETNEKNVISAY